MREAIGARNTPFDEALIDRYLVQAGVDPTAWESGRDVGRSMPLSDVVGLAGG
ncbi:MAG: hypothetical protein M3O55_05990 [Actinomycetota bacterium]|nr:hypothetical protein [Actinomycetota bacterium]